MAKKSDKNLLNENTIRRMMKLAEIDSLSSDFITRNYVNEEEELEESAEESFNDFLVDGFFKFFHLQESH